MHIPAEFEEVRPEAIKTLVQDYPLACVIAHTAQGLTANHMPLLWKNEHVLLGHMALANHMYQDVVDGQEVLCVFQGANAYISANDYPSKKTDHRKVPTWNYQVAHVHGKIRYFTDTKNKLAAVGLLTKTQEQRTNGAAAWKMSDAPKDYLLAQLEDLVVFEIAVTRIEAQSKFSQNRVAEDFDGVIARLRERGEDVLAQQMLQAAAEAK